VGGTKHARPHQLLGTVEQFCIQQHVGLFVEELVDERVDETRKKFRE
jgi:hypothetical protein